MQREIEHILARAKAIITEEVERAGYRVRRILLFGSRARGEARPDSEWDFFVVTDREPPYPERRNIAAQIRRRFVEAGFWGDVFIQSEEIVQKRRTNTGFLTYQGRGRHMNEEAVSIWIRRAENDLKIGKDELGTEDPATDAVCFHMQQCVEKYLKAFLVFHGKEFPHSHDIALLVSLCPNIDPEFARLTEWGVDALTDYSVEEAKRAVELAEEVRGFVRKKLAQGGFALP